jgi:hypothetical protein
MKSHKKWENLEKARSQSKMSEIMSEMFYRESVLNYLKKTGLLIYG